MVISVLLYFLVFFAGLFLTLTKGVTPMEFKAAHKSPQRLESHGDVRVDNYYWMRERDTQGVLDYLHLENARTAAELAPVVDLEKNLNLEMRSRIKETDDSVPVYDSGYFYYSRYQAGQEYRLHCRKKGSLEATEEVILDENQLAVGQAYFELAERELTTDQNLLAFAVDYRGRRIYDIHFKDLRTGKLLPDRIQAATPYFVWAEDGKTLFFAKQDPETLRSYQIYRYEIGSMQEPQLVFEEKDTTFEVGLHKSKTRAYLFIVSSKRDSAEWRILNARNPIGSGDIFLPRENKHEYALEDGGDRFFILTNWQAINFRLMEAPHQARGKDQWKEILAHDSQVFLEGLDVYNSHLVLNEKSRGLSRLRVIDRADGRQRYLTFDEEAYEVSNFPLPDYSSPVMRFHYQSLVHPPATFEENFRTHQRILRKQKEIPNYNQDLYETRRLFITARDGAEVPVSLVMKKGIALDGTAPLLLYGYGSYGLSLDHAFWSSVFSLIDRGFIFAQAHVRGGSEMGRLWYENGRLQHKMNTFYDFIDSAESLIAQNYTSKDHLHIMGGSAGGLLVGAVVNMRPDLFRSAIAQVPFVDVLTTMLDENIPLTTGEYNEWGDPRKKEDYLYMRQYSPYDNVEAKAYPHLLAINGYHDSQVQYWEAAKWIAKLRELKTNSNLLLLYTEMDAGHSGASGRFEALKVVSKIFAFMLMLEGISE